MERCGWGQDPPLYCLLQRKNPRAETDSKLFEITCLEGQQAPIIVWVTVLKNA